KLYDNSPDVQIIATGSSALQIDKGSADLSRRMTEYQLFGLSFREYLELELNVKTPVISLEDLLNKHEEYSVQINDLIQPLEHFGDYLKFGYYPFYRLDKKFYHQKLQQTIHLTLDVDLPAVESLNFSTIKGMKNLLFVLSQLVPYTPNIQNLASKINSPRNSVLKALDLMDKSSILNLLRSDTKGVSYLQKPEKIFLQNTNLLYVFNETPPNKGSLRETFFFNQLQVNHQITAPKFGDFMIDNTYTFEIGGKNKTTQQILGVPLSYIAADDIEFGSHRRIPLWLFGFLY
ncbi:MAG: AAA family ATPase, partial [Weeksellaceae bacterium]|nr:AAA family ATPase [Weeksellaceae bacterium]